jgi:transposase
MDTSISLICSGRRCAVKKSKHFNRSLGVQSDRGRRKFSEEFKQEAVRLMMERRESGVSLSQIGRELDVRPDQLRTWARRFDVTIGSGVAVAPGSLSPEEELRRLKRELEVTRQERDFLKKAAAFFAKESR